jgi:3'(2'), 5'-bisphosphate nucleotidase
MRSLPIVFALLALLAGATAHAAVSPYRDELRVARTLARHAGRMILKMRAGIKKETKDGGELVTAADRAASAYIVEQLARRFPHDLIISEETKQNWNRIRFARRVWFVDPLDGTKDYVRKGRDGFAVQIGLVEKQGFFDPGTPMLGVVYQPTIDRMYYAAPGVGSRLQDPSGDRPLNPSKRTIPERLRLITTASNRSPGLLQLKAAAGIKRERRMGSVGVKLGRIADGEYDVSFKPADKSTHPWDIAAPDAILTFAGGRFTTLTGRSFPYNRIDIPGGLLASNGVAHNPLLRRFAPLSRPSLLERVRSGLRVAREIVLARR